MGLLKPNMEIEFLESIGFIKKGEKGFHSKWILDTKRNGQLYTKWDRFVVIFVVIANELTKLNMHNILG